MANIMINERCNFNCPYCFASEFTLDKVTKNMSMEDFKYALEFSLSSGSTRIGIIGGEPTLHPQFKEIMELLRDDDRVDHVVVFTNGSNLIKYAKLFTPRKFGMLINYNSPNDIGKDMYDKVNKNLDALVNDYGLNERLTLGINMYKEDFDYKYIIKALKKYGKTHVRTSISMPMDIREIDHLEYMTKMKPSVFKFFQELEQENIMPRYDCNLLPPCVMTQEEANWIAELRKKFTVNHNDFNLDHYPVCSPVLDITVDMLAIRCFALSQETKADIRKFNNVADLMQFYMNQIDSYSGVVPASEKCKTCELHIMGKCFGGCLGYKIDRMVKAREYIQEMF